MDKHQPFFGRRVPSPAKPTPCCANCGDPLRGPGQVPRGQPTAWFNQCQACVEHTDDQLDLILDRPDGSPIMIYQCRTCGATRSCRPTWRTRCHVCLDERTRAEWVQEIAAEILAQDQHLASQVSTVIGPDADEAERLRTAVEMANSIAVATAIREAERPGWTVLAADVYGLPWTGARDRPTSHGTWGRHDACGTVAKLAAGSIECPVCGPEPGSRTHAARRDDPYLLYLVIHRKWQKFGMGDRRRVQTHLRGGAQVVQVLRVPFQDVVLAETALKRRHRDEIVRRVKRGMIYSFGQATEVTHKRVRIDLTTVLPGGEDVTSTFR
ncbi:MAG: hypothetical protein ACYCVZ_00315 [Streptosporangiaceae bacterium]